MDECIVEGSEDTSDAKNHLTFEGESSRSSRGQALDMRTFADLRV